MANLTKLILALAVVGGGMKMGGIGPFKDADETRGLDALVARAKAEGKDKIVVLLTGTDWCPYCKTLERNVINTSAWQDYAASEIVFESFEYPATRRPKSGVKGELLSRFDIEGFPTMIVLDSEGVVLNEQAGYGDDSPEAMMEWVRAL